MVDLEVGNSTGLTIASEDNSPGTYDNPNLGTVALMKAALTDHDGTYYTAERLNKMSYNDVVYAVKVNNLTTLPV